VEALEACAAQSEVKQAGCESCIDYIKQMKRLEFDLLVEREERIAFEEESKQLQFKLAEIEEENRDQVNMSLSYTKRVYAPTYLSR